MGLDLKDISVWIKGLIGAGISGAATAISSGVSASVIAPDKFNMQDGMNNLLKMIAVTHVVLSKPKLYGKLVKPVIEIFVALMLFVLLIPSMVIIAILIKMDSGGRIFYTQERVGKDGKEFTIIKFRTMVENAESNTGAVYTSNNDPRITKIGRFLRKRRLDEIPQLLNVIKGEMSLMGPRPERHIFIKKFEEIIPFYTQRLAVRPGLTGWAQVKYRYASSIEQTEEKLKYDLYYIKNMSVLLDFVVLLKTIKVVLFGSGK